MFGLTESEANHGPSYTNSSGHLQVLVTHRSLGRPQVLFLLTTVFFLKFLLFGDFLIDSLQVQSYERLCQIFRFAVPCFHGSHILYLR